MGVAKPRPLWCWARRVREAEVLSGWGEGFQTPQGPPQPGRSFGMQMPGAAGGSLWSCRPGLGSRILKFSALGTR